MAQNPDCCYAECYIFIVTQSVAVLNVILLSVMAP
jgi:hypothetical protein